MKTGVPWNVKGLRPEARETAREAARRAGMSVSDWLNSVIIDSAGEEVVRPARRGPIHDDPPRRGPFHDDPPRRRPLHDDPAPGEHLASVNERLAQLTQQIDRLTRGQNGGQDRHQDQARPAEEVAPRLAEAIARLDRRLDQLVTEGRSASSEIERRVTAVDRAVSAISRERARSSDPAPPASSQPWTTDIDRAVAEISARQRALDVDPQAYFTPGPPVPRHLPPAAEFATSFDRDGWPQPALGRQPGPAAAPMPAPDMSGVEEQLRALTAQIESWRHPWEEAVEALRAELADVARTLTDAMPRRAMEAIESEIRGLAEKVADTRQCGADPAALAKIEHGLGDLRDQLRALTPAEHLGGFDEAIRTLSRKIDLLTTSQQDPAALEQLEAAIGALRGVVTHVASDEALSQLASEVRELSAKVDRIAEATSSAGITGLERRIAMLADAMASRNEDGATAQLEGMLKSLGDKLERLQLTRSDHTALDSLEDRIVQLVNRLDTSGARLGHLDSIERALAELLVRLEGQGIGAPRSRDDDSEALRQGLAEFERRTQDTLEAVQGTLGHVVDRLALIETDMRAGGAQAARGPHSPPPAAPIAPAEMLGAPLSPSAASPAPPPSRPAPAAAAQPRGAAAQQARAPIDPNLPPDHPLEPGQGRGRGSPGERIAASEAALAGAKPPVIPDPAAGKSNFIAAARRAAQAAAAQIPPVAAKGSAPQPAKTDKAEQGDSTLGGRIRSLLVSASVVVIVLGTLHMGASLLGLYDPAPAPEPARPAVSESRQQIPVVRQPVAAAPAPSAPAAQPAANPAERRQGVLPGSDMPGPASPAAGVIMPGDKPLPAPPASDVTGSIGTPVSPAASASGTDRLPAGFGSPALRQAVANGDPTAAYEIGLRYAEGRGVDQSFEEAVRWFDRAAKDGVVPALFRLGGLYEKGLGVKKDLQAARRHYVAAAEKGHGKAMHNLAVLHAEGVDGKPDYKTATQWFRRAAGHGIADSQYNLGVLYARGIGIEQNLPESYKWFALAAQQGDQDSGRKRDDIAARLDAQALGAAKAAVAAFKPEPQPEAATTVPAPPGGWDRVGTAATRARTASR